MGRIIILDENTANKIAAGEVIERPASVVKELVENAIDAGASAISVDIKNGGISYIRVTDNGTGMEEDDVLIAFERHATSKIKSSMDLEAISTLGFRGEALASIAAVSSVELTTRTRESSQGIYARLEGGIVKESKHTGCPVGTTFTVKNLFYNTPARFKFLKKDSTEGGYISDILSRIALGNSDISFKLTSNNAQVLHTPGNSDLLSTIYSIYGKDMAKEVFPVSYQDERIKISGYGGKPEIARSTRTQQSLFINGRYIRSKLISSAVDEAYKTFLMKNRHPFFVINVEINPLSVDINVHPTKMEVRFSEEQEIFRAIYHAFNNGLLGKNLTREISIENKRDSYKLNENLKSDPLYFQQSLNNKESYIKEFEKADYSSKAKNTTMNTSHISEGSNKKNTFKEQLPQSWHSSEQKKNDDAFEPGTTESNTQHTEPTEEMQMKESTREDFSSYKVVGQAFSTYIILQHQDELILIDQHAAHERIMYEKLKRKYKDRSDMSQVLLTPVVIELTYKETEFIEGEKEYFSSLGYNFENFGNNSIILRSVPVNNDAAELKQAFLHILDKAMNSSKAQKEVLVDEALYALACKAAVKANTWLDDTEIKELLKGLDDVENPYTCPHGRPIAIKISQYELEKKFKRIV